MAKARPWRGLSLARRIAVCAVLTLLLAQRVALPEARAQSEATRHTQDIWLVAAVTVTDAAGNVTDATPDLKAAVSSQLDPAVALSPTLAYQKSESSAARVAAADGSTLSSIAVQLGLLTETRSDGSTVSIVAVVATPNLSEARRGVQTDDRIAVDLSNVTTLAGANEAAISYAFMQTLPPMDPTREAGLSDEEALGQRVSQHRSALLGTTNASGAQEAAVTKPQPLPVQHGSQTSSAVYLQAGPAVEGSFGALDALTADSAQLTAASQSSSPDTADLLAAVQAQGQLETGTQGILIGSVPPDDPNGRPSYPIGGPEGALACRTDVDSCQMDGTGDAVSGSFSWMLTFTLNISHGVVTGSGTWTEHWDKVLQGCTPVGSPQGPFYISGSVGRYGELDLTLEDGAGDPNGTTGASPLGTCNSASGSSTALSFFPEYIFQTLFMLPVDGSRATAHGCVRDTLNPQCVSTGGAPPGTLIDVTIVVADNSR